MENVFFERLPGYSLLRSLTQRLAGDSEEEAWKPALVEIEDALVPAFIIEELDDGRFTVFVPSVPTPLAGAVYVASPHCTPQKQQWVGTSRTPRRSERQPSAVSAPASRKSPTPAGTIRERRTLASAHRKPRFTSRRYACPRSSRLQRGHVSIQLAEPEPELVHRGLEIADEGDGLERLPAPAAGEHPLAFGARLLVDLHPHAGRTLDHVEELAERDEDQSEHHRRHVDDRQELVALAVEQRRGQGQEQTGDGDRDQGDRGRKS